MTTDCPGCGQPVPPEDNFCTRCGQRIVREELAASPGGPAGSPEGEEGPSPSGTPLSTEEQVRALRDTVAALQAELSRNSDRLSVLEGIVAPSVAAARRPPPAASTGSAAYGPTSPPPASPPRPPAPPSPAGAASGTSGPPPSGGSPLAFAADWNWEWLLGGNWLARIGIVAVVIGVGFFLKLAFDNNWIGETGRVLLGILGGVALLGGGEYWQRKYPIWAQPLTGGGLAVLYLSIFAAFAFYQLVPPLVAFGLFFAITLAAAGLALRYEAVSIAVLGIIGGFATPLLLHEQLPDQRLLLAYVLVLDLGVLALATFRNWRWFTLLAWFGSLVLFSFWRLELAPSLLLAQVGITLIFLIFVGATSLFHIVWRRAAGPFDQALMVLNAAAYFAISYDLMFREFRPWMGGFTLLLALFYALVAYLAVLRSREQFNLSLFAVGVAIVLVTIAVPVQLGGPWISVAWAAEGAVLIWLASYLRMPQLRWGGFAVSGLFAFWLLFIDTPLGFQATLRSEFIPFWNAYLPAFLIAIALTYLSAYLVYRERQTLRREERYAFPGYLLAGCLFLAASAFTQVEGRWLAVAWSVEALAMLALSFRLGLAELRLFGVGLLAVVTVRLLAFDTFNIDSREFHPVFNQRFLAFGVGIAALYLAAGLFWWWRDQDLSPGEEPVRAWYLPGLLGVASLLTLWLGSFEIVATVPVVFEELPRRAQVDITSLSLSVWWALYAVALLVLGVVRTNRWIRLAGLGLLAVPVVKLFVIDVFALEQEYRVAAFLVLGVMLLAGGFLYQRYSRVIRGFLFD